MNTLNENLPLFKNMNIQQNFIDTSNYENIKPKQKMPLSRLDVQTSKYFIYNKSRLLFRTLQKFLQKRYLDITQSKKL